jgi:hypothetical protein
MKKVTLALITGLLLSTSASAEKIHYYTATTSLWKDMGRGGTPESTFFYIPVVAVSAVFETIMAPGIAIWNIGRSNGSSEKSE